MMDVCTRDFGKPIYDMGKGRCLCVIDEWKYQTRRLTRLCVVLDDVVLSKYTWPNGAVYEGSFEHGQRQGHG